MILHSWQAQFRIKSGILGLTVEIPLWPPCFYPLFRVLFWGSWWSKFVGIRGAPRLTKACPRPGLGCKTYCGGPFMRPCFLSVFEPHFRGHDEAVFGCKKSIHYQMSQHEQQVTSNSTNIKQLSNATPKSHPQWNLHPCYTIELGKSKCEKRSNTENWLYSLGTRF